MNELYDLNHWVLASEARQDEIAREVLACLPGWEWAYADTYPMPGSKDKAPPLRIISFRETATGLLFNLLPGGTFPRGFSAGEAERTETLLRETESETWGEEGYSTWGPVYTVRIAPFLLMRSALNAAEAGLILDRDREEFMQDSPWVAGFDPEEVQAVLSRTGHNLPSEAQWEYACRGGMFWRLFAWGDEVPDVSKWAAEMDADDSVLPVVPSDEVRRRAGNRFGLVGMGAWSELCADWYHDGYEDAPTDGSPRLDPPTGGKTPQRVVRGGAAHSYPWQGVGEWVEMLCGARGTEGNALVGLNLRLAKLLEGAAE